MLKSLLKKFIDKKISKTEFSQLKETVNQTDDKTFGIILSELWDNFETTSSVSPEEVRLMLSQIKENDTVKTVAFDYKKIFRVAAAVMFPILSVLSTYLYVINTKLDAYSDNNVVISVDKGQKADVTLPDGSHVKLNSGSTLSYPAKFGADFRRIEFKGEGYFEVAKDASKKFIVHTNYIDIEVLGTTFNVMAHESDNTVEMTLIEGKVKAITQQEPINEIFVQPNQKIIYNKTTGLLQLKETNTKDEIAWTKGVLLFKSEPLNNVLAKIERNYNVKIHIKSEDSLYFQDKFTGRFDSIDLNGVMEIIKKHYLFDYKEKGKEIFIEKKKS